MNILGLFTGIWSKVAAGFAALAGVFFFIMRHQSNKIDKLEDENAKIEKKSEIQAQAAVDKESAVSNEQKKVAAVVKEVNSNDKDITVDDVNNW